MALLKPNFTADDIPGAGRITLEAYADSDAALREWLMAKPYRIDASDSGLGTYGAIEYSETALRLELSQDVDKAMGAVENPRVVWGGADLFFIEPHMSKRHRAGKIKKIIARFRVEKGE